MNQAQRIIVSVASVGFFAWFWGSCKFNSKSFFFTTDRLESNFGALVITAGIALYILWKTNEGDE